MLAIFLLCLVVSFARHHHAHDRPAGLSGMFDLSPHKQISHDTFHLGKRAHPHHRNRLVDGYAFLNLHRKSRSRLPSAGMTRREKHEHFRRNLTTHESQSLQQLSLRALHMPQCTGPIAEGAAWKMARGYYLHTLNRNGMSTEFIADAVQRSNDAWACGLNRFDRLVLGPLLGVIDESSGRVINTTGPDGINEIGFTSIQGYDGTVALTIVWGVMDGPVEDREIVEYDMLFDGEHYEFGNAAVDRSKMDLEEICTHETGHRLGLDDIYDAACNDVTMFGTSSEGEINKRTLSQRDLDGLSLLYGPLRSHND